MSDDSASSGSEENEDFIGVYDGDRNAVGERHGEGCATLRGGDTYQGQYESGLRHGRGEYCVANSSARYCGEWHHGLRHGLGVCVYADGSQYQGGWCKDKRHGLGTMHYTCGDLYSGEWKEGNREDSRGRYYFPGGVFVGNWKESKRHGIGAVQWTSEGPIFLGSWNNDKMEGEGMFVHRSKIVHGYFVPGEVWQTVSVEPFDEEKENLTNSKFEGLLSLLKQDQISETTNPDSRTSTLNHSKSMPCVTSPRASNTSLKRQSVDI